MKDIAPQIIRQRLLIEAKYTLDVDTNFIKQFFSRITSDLNLRVYGEPIIHSPSGKGKESNQGYDAFIPLIDSGISLYIWSNEKFLSCVIYTCKSFSTKQAIQSTKDFFKTTKVVFQEF